MRRVCCPTAVPAVSDRTTNTKGRKDERSNYLDGIVEGSDVDGIDLSVSSVVLSPRAVDALADLLFSTDLDDAGDRAPSDQSPTNTITTN